jgi:hypothetical protein
MVEPRSVQIARMNSSGMIQKVGIESRQRERTKARKRQKAFTWDQEIDAARFAKNAVFFFALSPFRAFAINLPWFRLRPSAFRDWDL